MTQRDDFVRCAEAQVGKRYVWATAGPNTFDCSGLVAYCYQQATGKEITRSSYDQITLGDTINVVDFAQPGDLAFWDTEHNGTAGHVGVIVEGGRVVSAMNPQQGVTLAASVSMSFGGPLIDIRRIFAPADSPIVEEPTPVEESPSSKPHRRKKRRRREDRP